MSARSASPFIGDVEPITESDDELRAILERGRAAAAAAVARLRHRRPLAAPGRPAPRPAAVHAAERRAHRRPGRRHPRARPRRAGPLPRRRLPTGAGAARRRRAAASWSSRSAAPTWPRTSPLLEEELDHAGEDRRAPTWHKDDVGAGHPLPGRRHRRRHVGPARRPPPAAGRGRVTSSSRRTTTSAAPGTRTATRAVASTTRTTTTATRSRSATTGRSTTRPSPCSTDYFRDCADAFGLRDRIRFGTEVVSAVWSDDDLTWTVTVRTADGRRGGASVRRGGERGRPAQPAQPADDHPRLRRASRARRSTRPAGTTTSTSPASGWRSSAPARARCSSSPRSPPTSGSCSSSSGRRRGSAPTPDYHEPVSGGAPVALRPRALATPSGTGSASSGGWATAPSPA